MHLYSLSMNIRAIVHAAEEGGYWAEVPALPGCVSQGDTMEELQSNIKEAVELWLEAGDENGVKGQSDQILELAL